MSIRCRLGLHGPRPAVMYSEGWPWPLSFTCKRCGRDFLDYGPGAEA